MTKKNILIIAKSHLIGEVLAEIVKKRIFAEAIYVDSEDQALSLLNAFKPELIIISQPKPTLANIEPYFQNNPIKIIILESESDAMLVYSRTDYSKATLRNLMKAVRQSQIKL